MENIDNINDEESIELLNLLEEAPASGGVHIQYYFPGPEGAPTEGSDGEQRSQSFNSDVFEEEWAFA